MDKRKVCDRKHWGLLHKHLGKPMQLVDEANAYDLLIAKEWHAIDHHQMHYNQQ